VEKKGHTEEFLMNAVVLQSTTEEKDVFEMMNSIFKQHG